MKTIDFSQVNYTRLITKLIAIAWALTVAGVIYFLWSLDVVDNWKLVMPKGPIHAGDTITVQSIYTKKRDVTGTAERYIECRTEDDILVSYPINRKKADRGAGTGGTGLVLFIPTSIPNLPTDCHIRVSIDYPVLPFRTVHESNISDTFKLLPETEESKAKRGVDNETSVERGNTPSPTQFSSQSQSLPNSTPDAVSNDVGILTETANTQRTEQPVTVAPPEPEPEQPAPEPEKGLFDVLTDIIRGII